MKKLLASIVITFMLFFSATAFAGYVWFDFNGDMGADTEFSLMTGENFGVDIYVSALTPVYTMGFDFTYDPTQVGVISKAANGAIWPFHPEAVDTAAGVISFMGGSPLGSSVEGDNVLLGSLEFKCLLAGVSFFETGKTVVTGSGFFGNAGDLAETMEWGTARINQVPIPGAFILLGSGLLGLVAVRRRR